MLVWCDNEAADGLLHATFKLSGSGEEIGLFGRLAGGNEVIDSHVFGVQTGNVSEGRATDGGASWSFFAIPTPGASNYDVSGIPWTKPGILRLLPSHPSPSNPQTSLRFEIPTSGRVLVDIYDIQGRLVNRLKDEYLPAGYYEVPWNGLDSRGGSVPSGVYFSRLSFGGEYRAGRLTLLH